MTSDSQLSGESVRPFVEMEREPARFIVRCSACGVVAQNVPQTEVHALARKHEARHIEGPTDG